MIEAVFFDMDNTLVETEWAAALATKHAVEAYGRPYDDGDMEGVVGKPWNIIFRESIEKYRLPVDEETFKEEVLAEKDRLLKDKIKGLPGATDAVRRAARRWPVAVVSGSFNHEVEETLASLGILEHIRFFLCNEDISPGKPDPAPYLEAARRLDVSPPNCVVFEDSNVGVRSAVAAGMYCILVAEAAEAGLDEGGLREKIPTLEIVTDAWFDKLEQRVGAVK